MAQDHFILSWSSFFRRIYFKSILGTFLILGLVAGGRSLAVEISLPDLEAAFIYQLTRYIEWPVPSPPADKKEKASFSISVKSDSPMRGSLERLAESMKSKGTQIEIRIYHSLDDLEPSNFVVIPDNPSLNLNSVLSKLQGTRSVTLGDTSGFGQRGVMVNFFTENSQLRFEINVGAIQKEKIFVSSQLLKLAKVLK